MPPRTRGGKTAEEGVSGTRARKANVRLEDVVQLDDSAKIKKKKGGKTSAAKEAERTAYHRQRRKQEQEKSPDKTKGSPARRSRSPSVRVQDSPSTRKSPRIEEQEALANEERAVSFGKTAPSTTAWGGWLSGHKQGEKSQKLQDKVMSNMMDKKMMALLNAYEKGITVADVNTLNLLPVVYKNDGMGCSRL